MHSKNPLRPNFRDNKQLEFVSLHNAMDNVFQKLRVEGVQANSNSTEAFLARNRFVNYGIDNNTERAVGC